MCCNMLFKMKMVWVYYELIYYIHKETAVKLMLCRALILSSRNISFNEQR